MTSAASPPPASPKAPQRSGELSRLLGWRPMQGLLVLLALALAIPAVRMVMGMAGSGSGGLDIDTGGASGSIENGSLTLDLPLSVSNGSPRVIMNIALWVDAYGCPDAQSPLASCTRLVSLEQSAPLRLMPGGSTQINQSITSGLPAHLAGSHLRIIRKLERVEDDTDALEEEREARFSGL